MVSNETKASAHEIANIYESLPEAKRHILFGVALGMQADVGDCMGPSSSSTKKDKTEHKEAS